MIKGILFDLDGTLIDTRGDLAFVVNKIFTKHGIRELQKEECATFMGWGIDQFLLRSYHYATGGKNLVEPYYSEYLAEVIAVYNDNPCGGTEIYPEVKETLTKLKSLGIKIAVVTNKAHDIAVQVVSKLFGDLVDSVQGPVETVGSEVAPKPDCAIVKVALDRLGLSTDEVLYVGDSLIDRKTAANSKVPFVAVSWGYEDIEKLTEAGFDYRIDHFSLLLTLI